MIIRNLNSSSLNYQLALGDIPRYISDLFPSKILPTQIPTFNPPKLPLSVLPPTITNNNVRRPRVGISWLGGGRADRLKLKSLDLQSILPILQIPDIDIISLQYGKVNSIIDKFNIAHGTNIIFPEIDPVKEFFEWTAVVEYCDFVVSVANTTIHAAGWLNKPTFCFFHVHLIGGGLSLIFTVHTGIHVLKLVVRIKMVHGKTP